MILFRRFEMWCRRQAAAAILPLLVVGWFTGESSEALTTFGKSNTQPPYQPPVPTAPPARECRLQSDCAGIAGTSCVRAAADHSRCLCGDDKPPVNGRCAAQYRGLRHMCSESGDCMEGLVCGTPNATDATPYQDRALTLCLCDSDSGYVEKDHYCSDAAPLKTSPLAFALLWTLTRFLD